MPSIYKLGMIFTQDNVPIYKYKHLMKWFQDRAVQLSYLMASILTRSQPD
jgi:hypothetical protein